MMLKKMTILKVKMTKIILLWMAGPTGEYFPSIFSIFEKEKFNFPSFNSKKKIIFLTCRVHPGETPSSFGLMGVIELLLSKKYDVLKQKLLNMFVFKIIPMINPDGVDRGHFRMDGHGVNLNRYYAKPDKLLQPSVYAITKLLDSWKKENRLFFFCDFHAHGSPKNCFFYGNSLNFVMQVESRSFAKLMSIVSPDFNYKHCNFSQKHMGRSDAAPGKDKRSKEGSARVSTYRAHHVVHSYTIEFGYHQNIITDSNPNPGYYTKEIFKKLGRSLLVCIAELFRKTTHHKVASSEYKTMVGIREKVASDLKNKYKKKESHLVNKITNIQDLIEENYYKSIKVGFAGDKDNSTTSHYGLKNRVSSINNKFGS